MKLKKNDKIGIFGRSGIGKTTLLKVLVSLIKPSEGQILIDDVKLEEKSLDFGILKLAMCPKTQQF